MTLYAHLRDNTGDVWNGSAFVDYAVGNWTDYDITLTEDGSSGYYKGTFPSTASAGRYTWIVYERTGGTPAAGDAIVGTGAIDWDGAAATTTSSELSADSVTAICNMALSHLGVGTEIADLETESGEEAAACRRFYVVARDAVLRDFPWPFATKMATLALIETDPNDEWAYSYRYPTDSLSVRRIISGVRNDTRQSRVPYKIGQDSSGLLIYTDTEDAEMEYTVRMTDPSRYPPDFTTALSFLLASYIAPRLTAGDPFKMGNRAVEFYNVSIEKAQALAENEEQPEEAPDSEFIRGRE